MTSVVIKPKSTQIAEWTNALRESTVRMSHADILSKIPPVLLEIQSCLLKPDVIPSFEEEDVILRTYYANYIILTIPIYYYSGANCVGPSWIACLP